MIVVNLSTKQIFSDEIEIKGIRNFELRYEPGYARLRVDRFETDDLGRAIAKFGAVLEQTLEFFEDEFMVIA